MAQELFGPYHMETLIGKGGMGEVWRAFDTVKKRTVAVKRLPHKLAADEAFQARFRREAELAGQLEHPHVIPIYDYGEIEGRLFMDMRFVDGPNLATLTATNGPLTPARSVDIISQVAEALDAAHTQGLVHRDIKPSNVLLAKHNDSADFVYLGDFGIARALSGGTSLTETGATVGSAEYMAPERFLGTADDHRADIYSLACVLYEALTGDKPFVGRDLSALMYAHVNLEPPTPSQHRPSLPPALDHVVAQGMAKDPAQRPPTAGHFAAAARLALSDARSAQSIAGTTRAARRAALATPRTPILTLLAIAAVAAFVVMLQIFVVPTANNGTTTSNAQAQPTIGPAPRPAPAPPVPVPVPVSEGFFAGRSDYNLALAIAIKGDRAVGYLCDGRKVEAWLEGTVTGDQVDLRGKKGAAVTGTLSTDATFSFGTVTINSVQSPYLAEIARKPAGLYEGRGTVGGVDNRIGWIVFPNGSQVGMRSVNGERSPAPRLDTGQLQPDGLQISVKPVGGGDDVMLGQ